ncbi:hypothetical protein TNCV_2452781 [Trichonephila clavipes]|nr:hypothetical protein TNCV_2452781 [Trichonephila clavipes]
MSSFLVLSEGVTRNRWRDGQVCPDVGQGTMAPWARRLGKKEKTGRERERKERMEEERGDGKREEKESGREREEPALYGEKG